MIKIRIRRYISSLHAADGVTIVFLAFLSLINLIFASRITVWWNIILVNIAVSGIIMLVSYHSHNEHRLLQFIHRWYIIVIIIFVFKEIYFMNRAIHFGRDYDIFLIAIDHAIFGADPTQWMMRLANPVLTEILQIAYASYYFLMIFLGYELYREKRHHDFSFALFCIIYGFYLSYLGYLTLPSVGPRFTLHDFHMLSTELPGLWFTEILRTGLNLGESIPMNAVNPIDFVQRDVFPSGHTQMTLITMYLSLHYRIRFRWVVIVIGSLLVISTVYLRYHYVVDLFAGAVFAVFTLWTAPKLSTWWNTTRNHINHSKNN